MQAKDYNIVRQQWLIQLKTYNIVREQWLTQAKVYNIMREQWLTQAKVYNIMREQWLTQAKVYNIMREQLLTQAKVYGQGTTTLWDYNNQCRPGKQTPGWLRIVAKQTNQPWHSDVLYDLIGSHGSAWWCHMTLLCQLSSHYKLITYCP